MSYQIEMAKLEAVERECVREINKLVDKIEGEENPENVRTLEVQIEVWEKKRDRNSDKMESVMSEEESNSASDFYDSQLIRPTDQDGGKPLPHER